MRWRPRPCRPRERGAPRETSCLAARVAEVVESVARDLRLVPWSSTTGECDRGLVAFAGEQHDVARASQLEGAVDRRGSVGDQEQIAITAPAGLLGARGDLLEDAHLALGTRVIVSEHDDARSFAGRAAHHRTLGDVARA